jgi:hypothetical protein
VAIVQDPSDAERPEMPTAAIASADPDVVTPLAEIPAFLSRLLLDAPGRSETT